jgi:tetraacyldisaccharide 4'-kinase
MLKTPNFWFKKDSFLVSTLIPFSKLYRFFSTLIYKKTKPVHIHTPLICVGNASLGGGGKTPAALAIGKILENLKFKHGFLTRGYKGETKGPFRVNALYHTAKQMGDEALILAKNSITYVAKDRLKGAQKMDQLKLDAIVMDDGYQNPKLKKDISFLVIDGQIGFGNEHIFPAGPLRESAEEALKKATSVIVVGKPSEQISKFIETVSVPVFKASIQSFFPKEIDKTTSLIAFSGLAYPKKFFSSLEDNGYNIIKKISFADHHLFTEKDFSSLREKARSLGAKLITTEKDYVRLTKMQRKYVNYVPIELCWDNENEVKKYLKKQIKECQEKTS